jgi:hypothetical protein
MKYFAATAAAAAAIDFTWKSCYHHTLKHFLRHLK